MSQAGIIEFESAHPNVPTSFVTDDGTAVPIANVLEILGTVVPNHHIPLETTGSGNTVTIVTQYADATVATTTTDAGVASFNNAQFTVDENGWVSLVGGHAAIESVAVQTGTSPIVPTAGGQITINGATVVAGTHPVRTDGTGPNTMAVEVQISQAIAGADATKIGLSAFDDARFTVDATGFVSINGSGVGETITGNTGGALSPTAGNWNIFGAAVVAGTTPVTTAGSGSTLTTNVQLSQAIPATDATKVGLSNFNNAEFTVDANGFVSLIGGGAAIESVALQSGTSPIHPTAAGQITFNGATVLAGTNPVRTDGTGPNTMALEVQISQAIPATDATKIGLSNFNNAEFTVDANGFVSLIGGGAGVENFTVDAVTGTGTNPVLPNAGNIIVSADIVTQQGIPIQTQSPLPHKYNIEVQYCDSNATALATKSGMSHFKSADFTVDNTTGFVSLATPAVPFVSGTWTPIMYGATTAGTTVYTLQDGTYVQFGNLVWVRMYLFVTSTTGTGDAIIDGLPFTVLNNSASFTNSNLGVSGWVWPTGATAPIFHAITGTTTGNMSMNGSGLPTQTMQMQAISGTFAFNIIYQIAA